MEEKLVKKSDFYRKDIKIVTKKYKLALIMCELCTYKINRFGK